MAKKTKDKDIKKAVMPKSKPDVINKDIMDMVDFENYEKKTGELHPEDPRAGDNMDTGKAFYEEGDKTVDSEIKRLTELAAKRKKFSGKQVVAAKGGSMPKQMEMFAEGGLKQEGGSVDPVSGNDVPVGSTKEEVRDDIPAQLSEGEFVMPADVVRFHGLDKMMQLRDEAKMGLKKMEAMGQMGNSEEATLPDDVPFNIDDLDTEDEPIEMAEGGIVQAANGTFVNPSTGIGGYQQSQFGTYNPTLNTPTVPTQLPTTSYIAPTQQATPMAAQQPLPTFGSVIPAPEGKPDEIIEYENAEGNKLSIPFVNGQPVYPIPTGYTKVDKGIVEAPKPPTPVAPKSTTSRVPTETGSNDPTEDDQITSTLGGARTSIGGVDYAISYGLNGKVSIQSIDEFKQTGKRNFIEVSPEIGDLIKTQTFGQIAQLGKGIGLGYTALAEIANKFGIDLPGYKATNAKIDAGKVATKVLNAMKAKDEQTLFGRAKGAFAETKMGIDSDLKAMKEIDEGLRGSGTERFDKEDMQRLGINSVYAKAAAEERDKEASKARRDSVIALGQERSQAEKDRQEAAIAKAEAASKARTDALARVVEQRNEDGGGGDGGNQSFQDQAAVADQQDGMFTAVGGFIAKKKKPKKMKQGGLASRK
jgi:hypothetical protein